MKLIDWADDLGRKWRVSLPDGAPDSDAPRGAPIGPPDLEPLGLPTVIMVRLHNNLHARQLFTMRDVRKRPRDVAAALQAALRADVALITALYDEEAD